MAKYCTVQPDKIIIRPYAWLNGMSIMLLVLFLLLPLSLMLVMAKGDLSVIEPENFAVYFFMLPLVLACLLLFLYGRRKIIFDKSDQTIYQTGILGTKVLLPFSEVAGITSKATLGIAYYITPVTDRYGKGIRISPAFYNHKDKDKQAFEQEILPAIKQILISGSAIPAASNELYYQAGSFTYYHTVPDGYLLRGKVAGSYIPALMIFGAAGVYLLYILVSKQGVVPESAHWLYFCLIPLALAIGAFTKRIKFETGVQMIRLYYFGLPVATYDLKNFKRFLIVRKTHNGFYNGTDVRMEFSKSGGKGVRELTLSTFHKTRPVEGFLEETEYIINRHQPRRQSEEMSL